MRKEKDLTIQSASRKVSAHGVLVLLSLVIVISSPLPLAAQARPWSVQEAWSPLFFDFEFQAMSVGLGNSTPNLFGQCNAGQREILQKLDNMRNDPVYHDFFAKYDYGPVSKEGAEHGHEGVVVYAKAKPGQSYEDAIKGGVVIDYTNGFSSMTGLYRYRAWDAWRWYDYGGKGVLNQKGKTNDNRTYGDYYWNPNGPTYPTAPITNPPIQDPPHTTRPQYSASITISNVASLDPNEKAGAPGIGAARYVAGTEPLRYSIFFENVKTATAPAQQVVIEDRLNPSLLDLATLRFGDVSIGGKTVYEPTAESSFSKTIDLRPAKNLLLRIEARADVSLGNVVWVMRALDPNTLRFPADPLVGFLPPDVNPPEGMGSVDFTVRPKAGIASGTVISNSARIIFDNNTPIQTNQWVNSIDNTRPASRVFPLSQPNPDSFEVQWSGTDPDSGAEAFTVYVSDDGGPYTRWVENEPALSRIFHGALNHRYSFFSIARDRAGNLEAPKDASEASTVVSRDVTAPITNLFVSPDPNKDGWNSQDVSVRMVSADSGGAGVKQITYSVNGKSPTVVSGASATMKLTAEGIWTIAYSAEDFAGNRENTRSWTIRIAKAAPEAVLEFDLQKHDLILKGRDALSGVLTAPVAPFAVQPVSWGNGGSSAEGNAELRSYRIEDLAGNSLVLVAKIKTQGGELASRIMSLQYAQGAASAMEDNQSKFTWSMASGRAPNDLLQNIEVSTAGAQTSVMARFDMATNTTTITYRNSKGQTSLIKPGYVAIRTVSDKGILKIDY
jgi:hypothetical protein